eukprot:CAMPEP_0118833692 /NCGR_PEP_ID=MMETSP1162-20130426/45827_1 /TAXON_ID=33656 /ORGANISM="Phaeocystis Sp, Strain CCMP2710" /LENGTH=128 /DNA_ID=CAMNT_0006765371 /DNA_START=210 /DNA_END=593 /DNA_ORIENTATION=+
MQRAAAPPAAVGEARLGAELVEADDADVARLGGYLLHRPLDEPASHLADGARALAPERGGDAGLQQRRRDHEHDQRVVHLLEARQHRVEILAGHGEHVERDPRGDEHDEGEGGAPQHGEDDHPHGHVQ